MLCAVANIRAALPEVHDAVTKMILRRGSRSSAMGPFALGWLDAGVSSISCYNYLPLNLIGGITQYETDLCDLLEPRNADRSAGRQIWDLLVTTVSTQIVRRDLFLAKPSLGPFRRGRHK